MRTENVLKVQELADELIYLIELAKHEFNDGELYIESGRKSADIKRKSMDLTRALSKMRQET